MDLFIDQNAYVNIQLYKNTARGISPEKVISVNTVPPGDLPENPSYIYEFFGQRSN
jgi:hypothetical protein